MYEPLLDVDVESIAKSIYEEALAQLTCREPPPALDQLPDGGTPPRREPRDLVTEPDFFAKGGKWELP